MSRNLLREYEFEESPCRGTEAIALERACSFPQGAARRRSLGIGMVALDHAVESPSLKCQA